MEISFPLVTRAWGAVRALVRRGQAIAMLEARVTALEEAAKGPVPPDACLTCGERACRLKFSRPPWDGERGVMQKWACASCGHEHWRMVEPR